MNRNSNQIQNMRIIFSTLCMNIAGPVSVTRVHGYSGTDAICCLTAANNISMRVTNSNVASRGKRHFVNESLR